MAPPSRPQDHGPAVSGDTRSASLFPNALVKGSSELIVQSSFEMEAGRGATEELLRHNAAPTAIFAANDPLAIGAICACRDAGLRIPEDISVMGVGHIEGPFHPNPFLTTIDWPRQALGRITAQFLLNALSKPGVASAQSYLFEPCVLARHSTGRLS